MYFTFQKQYALWLGIVYINIFQRVIGDGHSKISPVETSEYSIDSYIGSNNKNNAGLGVDAKQSVYGNAFNNDIFSAGTKGYIEPQTFIHGGFGKDSNANGKGGNYFGKIGNSKDIFGSGVHFIDRKVDSGKGLKFNTNYFGKIGANGIIRRPIGNAFTGGYGNSNAKFNGQALLNNIGFGKGYGDIGHNAFTSGTMATGKDNSTGMSENNGKLEGENGVVGSYGNIGVSGINTGKENTRRNIDTKKESDGISGIGEFKNVINDKGKTSSKGHVGTSSQGNGYGKKGIVDNKTDNQGTGHEGMASIKSNGDIRGYNIKSNEHIGTLGGYGNLGKIGLSNFNGGLGNKFIGKYYNGINEINKNSKDDLKDTGKGYGNIGGNGIRGRYEGIGNSVFGRTVGLSGFKHTGHNDVGKINNNAINKALVYKGIGRSDINIGKSGFGSSSDKTTGIGSNKGYDQFGFNAINNYNGIGAINVDAGKAKIETFGIGNGESNNVKSDSHDTGNSMKDRDSHTSGIGSKNANGGYKKSTGIKMKSGISIARSGNGIDVFDPRKGTAENGIDSGKGGTGKSSFKNKYGLSGDGIGKSGSVYTPGIKVAKFDFSGYVGHSGFGKNSINDNISANMKGFDEGAFQNLNGDIKNSNFGNSFSKIFAPRGRNKKGNAFGNTIYGNIGINSNGIGDKEAGNDKKSGNIEHYGFDKGFAPPTNAYGINGFKGYKIQPIHGGNAINGLGDYADTHLENNHKEENTTTSKPTYPYPTTTTPTKTTLPSKDYTLPDHKTTVYFDVHKTTSPFEEHKTTLPAGYSIPHGYGISNINNGGNEHAPALSGKGYFTASKHEDSDGKSVPGNKKVGSGSISAGLKRISDKHNVLLNIADAHSLKHIKDHGPEGFSDDYPLKDIGGHNYFHDVHVGATHIPNYISNEPKSSSATHEGYGNGIGGISHAIYEPDHSYLEHVYGQTVPSTVTTPSSTVTTPSSTVTTASSTITTVPSTVTTPSSTMTTAPSTMTTATTVTTPPTSTTPATTKTTTPIATTRPTKYTPGYAPYSLHRPEAHYAGDVHRLEVPKPDEKMCYRPQDLSSEYRLSDSTVGIPR